MVPTFPVDSNTICSYSFNQPLVASDCVDDTGNNLTIVSNGAGSIVTGLSQTYARFEGTSSQQATYWGGVGATVAGYALGEWTFDVEILTSTSSSSPQNLWYLTGGGNPLGINLNVSGSTITPSVQWVNGSTLTFTAGSCILPQSKWQVLTIVKQSAGGGLYNLLFYLNGALQQTLSNNTNAASVTGAEEFMISGPNFSTFYTLGGLRWSKVARSGASILSYVQGMGFGNTPTVTGLSFVNATTVIVQFATAVDLVSSVVIGNYSIPGLTVSAASYIGAGQVQLTTTAATLGTTYTVTVTGVKDVTATNTISTSNTASALWSWYAIQPSAPVFPAIVALDTHAPVQWTASAPTTSPTKATDATDIPRAPTGQWNVSVPTAPLAQVKPTDGTDIRPAETWSGSTALPGGGGVAKNPDEGFNVGFN